MTDVKLLALLTLALCWSPFETRAAFKGASHRKLAASVVQELLRCVDDAYAEVGAGCCVVHDKARPVVG